MTRKRSVLLSFVAAQIAACTPEPRPSAEPAPFAAVAASPSRTVMQRVTEVGPVREPTPEELPVVEDFVHEAEQQITAATFRAELDAIEKEMNAEAR